MAGPSPAMTETGSTIEGMALRDGGGPRSPQGEGVIASRTRGVPCASSTASDGGDDGPHGREQ